MTIKPGKNRQSKWYNRQIKYYRLKDIRLELENEKIGR